MRDKSVYVNSGLPARGSKAPAHLPAADGPERLVRTQVNDARLNGPPKSRRLHRKDAAFYLGVSLSWLDKSRMVGRGPTFITLGSRVVYDIADLDNFLRQNRHEADFGP